MESEGRRIIVIMESEGRRIIVIMESVRTGKRGLNERKVGLVECGKNCEKNLYGWLIGG